MAFNINEMRAALRYGGARQNLFQVRINNPANSVGDAITPFMGSNAGLKAFTAAVVGGIGSIPGAMLGGMLLGFTEYFTVVLISSSWRDAVSFLILIVFLLVRPYGILGKKARDRA